MCVPATATDGALDTAVLLKQVKRRSYETHYTPQQLLNKASYSTPSATSRYRPAIAIPPAGFADAGGNQAPVICPAGTYSAGGAGGFKTFLWLVCWIDVCTAASTQCGARMQAPLAILSTSSDLMLWQSFLTLLTSHILLPHTPHHTLCHLIFCVL